MERGIIPTAKFNINNIRPTPEAPIFMITDKGFMIGDPKKLTISSENEDLIFTAKSWREKRKLKKLFKKLKTS